MTAVEQLPLPAPDLPTTMDMVWDQHQRILHPMSRETALADPVHGPLLRMHARLLERRLAAVRRRGA